MVSEYAKSFAQGRWSLFKLGSEVKWNATDTVKPEGEWDRVASPRVENFIQKRSSHIHSDQCAGPRSIVEQRGGRKSIHFFADAEPFETIFRTILSANQLSIHGAVADLCDEFEIQVGPDKTHVVEDQSESTLTGVGTSFTCLQPTT